MIKQYKFEALKNKAKRIVYESVTDNNGYAIHFNPSRGMSALIAIATQYNYAHDVRPHLTAFAASVRKHDPLATEAKKVAAQPRIIGNAAREITMLALNAREEALDIIDRWDVREVHKLIDLFPGIVPAALQNAQASCFMADNDSADWMVALDSTKQRMSSSADNTWDENVEPCSETPRA